jgi:group I intron endonuclease
MRICLALLKYGYSNFRVEILEYCEPSQCIEREKHYIKLLSPEYNIVQDPTLPPMSGRTHFPKTLEKMSGKNHHLFGKTHSHESLRKMSEAKKAENNYMFGKKHTDETITKMSDAKTGKKNAMFGRIGDNHPMFGKNHSDITKQKMSGKPRPLFAGKPSQKIEILDILDNTTVSYNSISEAARILNISVQSISKYFLRNQKKPYKGRYVFKKID